MQLTNGGDLLITDGWSFVDDGNSWWIAEAGTYDLTDILATINAFEQDVETTDVASLSELTATGIYAIKSRSYGGYLKGNTNDSRTLYNDEVNLNDEDALWRIYKDDDGYVFYNIGTSNYLVNQSKRASSGEWKMTDTPLLVYNTLTEAVVDGTSYYSIQNVDQVDIQSYLHIDGSKQTVNWGLDAEASYFIIQKVSDSDDITNTISTALMNTAKTELNTLVTQANTVTATTGIGYYTAVTSTPVLEARDAAVAVNNNESATKTQILTEICTLIPKINALAIQLPELNKFYRFNNAATTANYVANDVTVVTDGTGANTIFYFTNENEKDVLIGYSNGVCPLQTSGGNSTHLLSANNTEYSFVKPVQNIGQGQLGLKWGNRYVFGEDAGNLSGGSYIENGRLGYNWVVEEVSSLPVYFPETKFATLYLPVAVTIPEGVTAWRVGQAGDDKVTLNKVSGAIPANTPVILHESGEHQSEAYAFVTTNEL